MGAGHFRFKQFLINQQKAGMRVTTDACLFGAWAPVKPAVQQGQALDIGAGTGLLSLMLAQRCPALSITAIEPEAGAVADCRSNFAGSPWVSRLSLVEGALQDYEPPQPFQLIICNPPFFTNHLTGPAAARNQAIHTQQLPFAVWVDFVAQHLAHGGQFFLLLPPYEMAQARQLLAIRGLHATQLVQVRPVEGNPVFRTMAVFEQQPEPAELLEEELVIKEADGEYSPSFTALLKPFYLYL